MTVDTSKLIDKVQENNRKAVRLAIICYGMLVIAILAFLTVFTIVNTQRLQTLVKNDHLIAQNQTKEELNLLKSTAQQQAYNAQQAQRGQQLLREENEYLACLVQLYSHVQNPTASQLATCPEPNTVTDTSSSGGAAKTAPKSQSSVENTPPKESTGNSGSSGSGTTGSSESSGNSSGSSGGNPPSFLQKTVVNPVTNLVKKVTKSLGL